MDRQTSRHVQGIGASPGIAHGAVYVIHAGFEGVPQFHIAEENISAEMNRFSEAVEKSAQQMQAIRGRMSGADGGEHLLILEAHLLMLNDAIFVEGVRSLIREENINAEWALRRTIDRIGSMFAGLSNEYFRERGSDVEFVGQRILRNLLGHPDLISALNIPPDAVIIAHDLSPADTADLTRHRVRALVTEVGSRTSHAAIVARSLDIPAVVGAHGVLQLAGNGDRIVVDGFSGSVTLSPTASQLSSALQSENAQRQRERDVLKLAHVPAITRDGFRITVSGNVELASEAASVLAHGGEGVGLYRSEFLYVGRSSAPTEDEHLHEYRALCARMAGATVTIRTLDLGGDKLFGDYRLEERNPALGLRAIRLCLQRPELFQPQLRAIAQVAAEHPVRVMFPMICDVSEIRAARALLTQAANDLRREGLQARDDIPVGIMVETPAAAIMADVLCDEVDFFSVGTNDLIQYCLAIDRGNEHVASNYRPLHPAVLRLLSHVTTAASRTGIGVSVCGEMASELFYLPVLIGLGFQHLSMNPVAIPWIKKMVREANQQACAQLANDVLHMRSAAEAEEHVKAFIAKHHPSVDLQYLPT